MKYDKPESVSADDFGYALHLINSDAVVEIMQYGTYGTPSLRSVSYTHLTLTNILLV